MSYSTHAAISGGLSAAAHAHDRCVEAIQKLEAVRTAEDFAEVTAWAKQFDWFFRSSSDDIALRSAFGAAKQRALSHEKSRDFTSEQSFHCHANHSGTRPGGSPK